MDTRWGTRSCGRWPTTAAPSSARSICWAAWGGEEFAVLLPETAGPQAAQVAERLRARVAAAAVAPAAVAVTISLGVVTLEAGASSLETVLATADRALYQAKAGGRNQVVIANALGPQQTAPPG